MVPTQCLDLDRPFQTSQFFRSMTIFAPSRYNRDFLITVNDEFAFVPGFSSDGAPGFSGTCFGSGGVSASPARPVKTCPFRRTLDAAD
ncbi:hypothetical protein F6X37_15385 [Paraburkholderia sp. 31.1]|uniref:hypothetical protein n=1 Tax=Paraburkholderia sp. 31.1 TaxID=2615205 RepID=UPI00165632B7|nr:hypothetical protein [Paraburkholderia sp. 31.1]MBC8722935.1 hypothetical protein [Paraburkholderia sp. 31.1]